MNEPSALRVVFHKFAQIMAGHGQDRWIGGRDQNPGESSEQDEACKYPQCNGLPEQFRILFREFRGIVLPKVLTAMRGRPVQFPRPNFRQVLVPSTTVMNE
jgi:hypothetical protein